MWHAFKLTVLWHCTSPRQWKWNTWPSTRRDTVINRTSYTCCFCGCGTWLVCLWSGTLAHSVCRGPICKCEDNFNIILHEESVRIWIWFVFRNSGQWWAFVSAVMNWGFYKTRGFYSLVEQLSDSQKRSLLHEVDSSHFSLFGCPWCTSQCVAVCWCQEKAMFSYTA